MDEDTRAQSETVGVVLLTGVVVVLIGLISVVVLGGLDTTADPVADLRISGNETRLTVEHAGGDEFGVEDLRVVIDGEQDRIQFTFAVENVTGKDATFEFGDRLVRKHGFTERSATVRIVDTSTNTIVAESRIELRTETTPSLDPIAEFTVSPQEPNVGQAVTFDASGSSDPDGRIESYEWEFGDGTTATGEQVMTTYSSTGEYDATLTVTDDSGQTATKTRTVTVRTGDTEPPSISSFGVANPSGQNVRVALDSDEQLSTIAVDISNAESATLTGGDFTESESGGTYTYAATYPGASDGTYEATLTTATDDDGNDGAAGQSDSVTVDTTAPAFASTSLTDSEDGNGIVTSGDSVNVSVTVSDATAGVDTVTADASAFDAGTVTLTGGNGDGVYNTTFTVGQNPVEGDQTVTVTAVDTAGNAGSTTTGVIEVDTTAPTISLFEIDDNSDDFFFGDTEYDVQWSVSDENLETATVQLEGGLTGAIYENVSEPSGDQTLVGGPSGFPYIIRIEAVDAAGNDVCREIIDTADGSGTYTASDASAC
jgi:FlaG/FlaF family flagellin (archaellin)